MKLIEEKLHQLHAEAKEEKQQRQQESGAPRAEEGREIKAPLRGFAKVNVVTDNSPAALAVGLLKLHTMQIMSIYSMSLGTESR